MIERLLNWWDRRQMEQLDRKMWRVDTRKGGGSEGADTAQEIQLAFQMVKLEGKYSKVRHRYLKRRYKHNPIGAIKAGYDPKVER